MDKKNVVHCLNCARKISDSLHNFVILEQYSKEELFEIYDKFVLFVPPVTPQLTAASTTSNSITTNTATNSTTIINNVNKTVSLNPPTTNSSVLS